MDNTVKWILGITVALIVGAALVVGGIFIGQGRLARQAAYPNIYGMMGPYAGQTDSANPPGAYGYGMMGGYYGDDAGASPYGMMGPGMMGAYDSGLADAEPLTIEEAEQAIDAYLASIGNDDLERGEVMIFDNNAYGIIVEQSTGVGAMEVLVDPATKTVYPEYGPNMMWNLKYSPMGNTGGMMGGMMGRGYTWPATPDSAEEMPVTEEAATESAQTYLDANLPGATADEHADAFYGYYTLHVLRDGAVVGMLSVNGYTGEVWLHTWHGDFIEMAE